MKALRLCFVLVVVIGAFAPGMAPATDASQLLRRADEVRSSDPATFNRLLTQLDQLQPKLTAAQKRHLQLLDAYRDSIAGRYDEAIRSSLALYENAPEIELKYRAGLLVANVAAVTRDFGLGLRYLERSLELEPKLTDPQLRQHGYGVAAALYNQFGQYELGEKYAERMLAEGATGRNRCAAKQFRAEALLGLGRLVDSDAEIQAAIDDCASQKEAIFANLIRRTLAQRWAANGEVRRAVALLEASLPEVMGTHYTRLIGEIRSLLAEYRLKLGNEAAAEADAHYVATIEGQDAQWLPSVTAHHVLYEIALRRGDSAKALDEYRKYAEAERARLDDIKTREYAFQLSRHELSQKNQSIALLKSQNQLLLLQQQATRASAWNTRLAIALLLVLVASVGYWGWRARRMHGSLRTLAETDGLTGLSNRRHFRARSEAALALCAQRKRPACVLLFDLDHFKQINDQCGHSSGDWVLREVARVGRLHCREQDLFGRIGGEEFAMTLVDCDAEAAMRTAEACRRAIAGIDASVAGCGQPVAASIGVVTTSVSGYEYEALIAHADAAMYRSKVAGRNRVTLYERPPVPQPGVVPAIDRRNAEAMLKQY
ncbi:sensor domain-containing diguanylate cyclase [Cognatilysobacter terrigena]|uniref:sensor domain-containing diguanylate cyclase n=1 Tax=Cognatilysobacter terrigena TaxID=2488749 RepID=UPI00105F3EC5|nr:GGDEF domain-containing protein [Lysobacter terrigena]